MSTRYPHLYLIGLTGNIGCGKSTVVRLLAARGAAVCDADQVTREVMRVGEPAYQRIVEEFGSAPTYPNVASAVAAAVDGDRILVKNRAGDIPWIENITIDKSLQFLSYVDNGFFVVQGTYSIVPATGRQVTIIGMRNTAGGIQAATGSSAVRGSARSGRRCPV